MSKKSVPFVNEACSEIIKGLKSLGSKYSTWSVFEDWLKCCSISISNSVDYIHREQREKEYLEIIKKYRYAIVVLIIGLVLILIPIIKFLLI